MIWSYLLVRFNKDCKNRSTFLQLSFCKKGRKTQDQKKIEIVCERGKNREKWKNEEKKKKLKKN